jgi:hypothetical protein|tara:strand:+ start:6836 stop:6964 length:129 start_codon:yes stop_codon:yes gene_type:complete
MGKGSKQRPILNKQRFSNEFDRIFKKSTNHKKSKKKDTKAPR